VIDRLLVEPGKKVPVGTPLALLHGRGEPAAPPAAPPPVVAAKPPPPEAARPMPAPVRAAPPAAGRRVSPAARVLAAERGVDLDGLAGSGPDGAVVRADVERALGGAIRPREARGPDLAAMRRAIGAAMARSKREIPHYYLSRTVDATPLLAWLEQANAARPPAARLLLQVPILKAVALALRQRRAFNGF